MVVPWLGRQRFVLVVGDEGALLLRVAGGSVADSQFAPAGDDAAAKAICDRLATRRRAPVTLLLDTQEQLYRQESLPDLGSLDRRRLIARRFAREMAGLSVGGMMPRRESRLGRAKGLLIAGAAAGPAVDVWLDRLGSVPNPVSGVGLLPLESAGLAARLRPPSRTEGRLWTILIDRHRVSGLRQIVVCDGEFVLTRLTALRTPAALDAASVASVFEETREYLVRSGLAREDGVAVVILAGAEEATDLETIGIAADSVSVMTPAEAARRLGLGLGEGADGSADLLHGAFAAGHRMALPLIRAVRGRSPAVDRWLRPPLITRIAAAGLAVSVAWTAASFIRLDMQHAAMDALRDRKAAAEGALSEARVGVGDLPEAPERMLALIEAWRATNPDLSEIEPLWHLLAGALTAEGRARRVSWTSDEAGRHVLDLAIALPPTSTDRRLAAETAERIAGRLRAALPDHTVSVVADLTGIGGDGALKGEVGDAVEAPPAVVPTVGFRITGPRDAS